MIVIVNTEIDIISLKNDTNIPESYNCEDCGAELEIPEPDWDLMYKEQ